MLSYTDFLSAQNIPLFPGFASSTNACILPKIHEVGEMEVVLTVTQESDGGFVAEGLGYDIFTQADTWEDLRKNAREAVDAYFFDQTKPESIRLHMVRDEVLAMA